MSDLPTSPVPFLSIVSPVYRAENIIDELVRRIQASVEPITADYEIVLVDDRSPDGSWNRILAHAARDPRVRGLRLTRNFGQHRAITAGLEQSAGQWVVVMDCDLQDQPEAIPLLFAQAQQGYEIVFAQRANRQDPWLKKFGAHVFSRIISYLTDTKQDPTTSNFGIFHRKVVDAVLSMRESIRYFPNLVHWVGFRKTAIAVEHARRAEGVSSYDFRQLFNLALDVILAYSDKPLRLVIKLGLSISAFTFLLSAITVFRFLAGHAFPLGYASLIISIWFCSGLLLSVLGMVGLYLGKTFEQVKNRPLYLADETTASPSRA